MFGNSSARVCLALAFACASVPAAAQQPSLGALANEVAARRGSQPPPQALTAADRARLAARLPLAAPWKTEQEWIVSDVLSALQNIGAAANGARDPGPANAHSLPGSQQSSGFNVYIADHMWAPAAYVPSARAVLGSRPAQACAPAGDELIGALLDPTTEIIQRENVRVSGKLKRDLRCPAVHEEAALLIGSLALREAAGMFTDTRRLISRMTAHLAAADALQAEPGRSKVRVLADTVLLTLVGRQKDALTRLSALGPIADNLDLQAWDRGLRMRITQNWRLLAAPRRATLFEQLAWFRALTARLGEEAALNRFDDLQDPAQVVDWGRMLMEPARGAGVEGGNRFGEFTLSQELSDVATLWSAYSPAQLSEITTAALVEALNQEPLHGPVGPNGLWVIDWGTWAATTQRHLVMEVNAIDTHLHDTLAVRGRGEDYRNGVRGALGRLRLFPLIAVSFEGTTEQRQESFAGAVELARTRPELLTDWMWKCLIQKDATAPASADWFFPFFPLGTVYDSEHRPFSAGSLSRFSPAQIAEYRASAPYARALTFEAARPLKDPSLAVLTSVYGEQAGYDLEMARSLATQVRDNPAEYARRYEAISEMDPGERNTLADYYADRGDTAAAVQQYEQWLATSDNEVSISHGVGWLLRYYFESGEQEKATRLADRVADTYSYAGLKSKAKLLDWRGDVEGAERLLKAGIERYEMKQPSDLLAFYLRHNRRGPDVDRIAKTIFPAGMKRVTSAGFRQAPTKGVRIRSSGDTGRRYDVQAGDVIVAVDGYAVTNYAQYTVTAGMSTSPDIRLLVWRQGQYRELNARLRHNWVRSWLEDYTPPQSAALPVSAVPASAAPTTR